MNLMVMIKIYFYISVFFLVVLYGIYLEKRLNQKKDIRQNEKTVFFYDENCESCENCEKWEKYETSEKWKWKWNISSPVIKRLYLHQFKKRENDLFLPFVPDIVKNCFFHFYSLHCKKFTKSSKDTHNSKYTKNPRYTSKAKCFQICPNIFLDPIKKRILDKKRNNARNNIRNKTKNENEHTKEVKEKRTQLQLRFQLQLQLQLQDNKYTNWKWEIRRYVKNEKVLKLLETKKRIISHLLQNKIYTKRNKRRRILKEKEDKQQSELINENMKIKKTEENALWKYPKHYMNSNDKNKIDDSSSNRNKYMLFKRNLVNSKYYLITKIKDLIRKKKTFREISVILMPKQEEQKKTKKKKRDKMKKIEDTKDIKIEGEGKKEKEKEKEKEKGNTRCELCIVNRKKTIFALKLKEYNKKNVPSTTENNFLSNEKEYKMLNLSKSNDLNLFYDYENRYHTQKEIMKWQKISTNRTTDLQYIMSLLKNPYKMIDFTNRLLLMNPYKYDMEKGIDRYKYKTLHYAMKEKLGQGAYGEIWFAVNINKYAFFKDVVLKKFIIHNKDEQAAQISAMREIYFGQLLKDCDNISRFIEYFEEYEKYDNVDDIRSDRNGSRSGYNETDTNETELNETELNETELNETGLNETELNETGLNETRSNKIGSNKKHKESVEEIEYLKYIWLVYVNEGYSLSQHLFEPDPNQAGWVNPSSLWWNMKKQKIGMLVLKDLIYQILKGIHIAHEKNITHRDIKMENIFVSSKSPFTVRIGDWGSAVELNNPNFLFIPSEEEETEGYQPPESLFGPMINNFMRHPYYDMWGIGIVFLQVVLGTKNPLEIKNKRYQAKLENIFSKISVNALKEAIFLQSLSELCLTPWYNRSDHLVVYQKENELNFSSKFQNNIIIKKLKLHLYFSALSSQNEAFNIVYMLVSQKYKSLISIPQSSLCSDWKCVNKYTPSFKLQTKQETLPLDSSTYKNMNDVFNERKEQILHNKLCNDEHFQEILKERDPSGIGLPNANARDLLRQLLQFDYTKRITAEQALKHPWFLEE